MSKTESPADATTARLPRYDFRHKVAVVTGGSRGLGRAIVERLERDGASVWVLDVAPDTTAPRQLVADVTDPEALARCAETIRAQSGGIDILVHSAGMAGATAPLVESDPKTWRRVVDINLVGAFEVCRCFVPHLLERPRAWLVNLASLAGKEGTPNASAYSAAKAGVVALTKSLAKEHATTALRINALAPAAIDTELLGQMSPDHVQTMIDKSPQGRLGRPDEVAEMVAWMVSEACSFQTGAVFDLSGGRAVY
ncbi:3-oxoacyl-[acyl-carrier-protein] reductase FabG [Halomonas sp. THAF12]|uniref:SDR family NAD(P)-dependent oxidoreductase n=1 Tax=Halomonas sp. THAF12 TaxID=2587849 RepID=UPI001267D2E5|nr:SDR family NAD(P)-dependent oxidoreductase [Halomonas sp. THAF12]QFT83670.1 3-oxoacyl-[acyl-carrier-protein] reductase FabG [Halomonas sp. THAF12]